jgi:hypothetical protein
MHSDALRPLLVAAMAAIVLLWLGRRGHSRDADRARIRQSRSQLPLLAALGATG